MRDSIRQALSLATVIAALAIPASAEGQLGGLVRKKIGDKIAEKTVDKVMPTQQGSQAATPPRFDDVVLEVTTDRFDAFLRGLEAERQAAREYASAGAAAVEQRRTAEAKYERERAEYLRVARAHTACMNEKTEALTRAATSNPASNRMMERMMAMSDSDRERVTRRMEHLAALGEAADRRNDNAAKMAVLDSLDAFYRKEFGMSFREMSAGSAAAIPAQAVVNPLEACGAAPVEPSRPEVAGSQMESESDFIAARAARASGLSPQQFGVMRERVQMWWSGSRGGYSQAELTLFESRRDELKKHERQFTHGTPSEWLR